MNRNEQRNLELEWEQLAQVVHDFSYSFSDLVDQLANAQERGDELETELEAALDRANDLGLELDQANATVDDLTAQLDNGD